MAQISIDTLTPVHIGSGRELMENTEFIPFSVNVDGENETHLVVLDEAKVLDVIGKENMGQWLSIIDNNKDLKAYLLRRKPDLRPDDVKKRSMVFYGQGDKLGRSLKEQLFDGRGTSYIPGSSIKGAMRTAILAHYARKNPELAGKNLKGRRGFTSEELEKKLFGSNPNESVFRFLQVGDAYFDYLTIALRAEIFNQHFDSWKFKKGGDQLTEAIPDDAVSSFKLKINNSQLALNNPRGETEFLNERKLFEILNIHTIELLNSELEFFEDKESDEEAFGDYIAILEDMKEQVETCGENEAVLRLGFGSGWKFMTGGWAKRTDIMNEKDYDEFLFKVRRQGKYDDSVPFPKSRKMGDEGDLFGFVKLKKK